MRLPILVLCLAVIYGTCKIYGEENVNLIESAKNGRDYGSDYSIMPLERSLSRHRRSLLSPVAKMGLGVLGIGNNPLFKIILDFVSFVNGLLNDEPGLCPKVNLCPIKVMQNILTHPIGTVETVLCYVFNAVGSQGRMIIRKVLEIFSQFIRRIFLPRLHTTLNLLAKTQLLPPSLRVMVEMFNVLYAFLTLIGYVQG